MRFSSRLALLIDGSPWSRKEWAEMLGVTKPAISQWVTGKNVPRPHHLAAIVGIIREDARIGRETKGRVTELLNAPISELFETPKVYRGRTLGHYLIRPVREATVSLINQLSPAEQFELYTRTADECRRVLARKVTV